MRYVMADTNSIKLEVHAIKEAINNFLILKKIISTGQRLNPYEDRYEMYELTQEEATIDFKSYSKDAFIRDHLRSVVLEVDAIEEISCYVNGEEVRQMGNYIKVLVFEPYKPSVVKEIEHTLEGFRQIVGGSTEYVSVGRPDLVLICNEDGMLLDLPKDRGFYGTFFVTGLWNGESVSLSEQQIKEVRQALEKRKNFSSNSSYLSAYFEEHEIQRKMFNFDLSDINYHIGTESVIEFILSQENPDNLRMIEAEIKDIEKNGKDIYTYLEKIAYQMAKKQNANYKKFE
ncbi:DUF3846 domain-containing protein (plasmid) [Aneurinibacillus sp. Ricciae_BoGa-3]|uniref:DUF3846 domain-containing protein n=1 Tax=Aneurinibacillus sp. Ricciae_BoGa-3 TaxID=3022697 RepID=UPI0023408C7D|nr:DUF3846 domain-containing protein [Aneurinibacillus sp. Ricciae_BoGa-3]WCK57237.1 DUF3846 domain-containing protein [Aneurinibacillus sp. Ricciae_BoGa-3]